MTPPTHAALPSDLEPNGSSGNLCRASGYSYSERIHCERRNGSSNAVPDLYSRFKGFEDSTFIAGGVKTGTIGF